jgi:dienelactone hydrolase
MRYVALLTFAALAALPWVAADEKPAKAEAPDRLPDTKELTETGDLAAKMMDGAHRFLDRRLAESVKGRERSWNRDGSSAEAYAKSVEPNREHLRTILGVVDARVPPKLECFAEDDPSTTIAETDEYRILQVRWRVLEGVTAEGLLLDPKRMARGCVVALPDADQTPEQIAGLAKGLAAEEQFARRLAESGVQVLVPVLVSRDCTFSGNPRVAMTNQPHREWIYRQAYHMGRHVIGYEVQKTLAAVDWFTKRHGEKVAVGVVGYGEGGLIAFYSGALDPRVRATLVSGYFGPRERVWEEPLYRNVWGLLREFGDAEVASLIAPRGLVVEYSEGPKVDGPPEVPKGRRGGAAVGALRTPSYEAVKAEFARAEALVPKNLRHLHVFAGKGEKPPPFDSVQALDKFLELLTGKGYEEPKAQHAPVDRRKGFDPAARQERQVRELEAHVQNLLRGADRTRDAFFLNNTTLIKTLAPRGERFRMYRVKEQPPDTFVREVEKMRTHLAKEIIGEIDDKPLPPNARSRKIYDKEKWVGYDVVLDVFPDVFAWGVLLVPKDIKPGERRPVVVCQHGRNGLPQHTIEGDTPSYHNLAARLADRGFVTFSPHNLYRGEDLYRMLNRKGNPLKLSLFSFIVAQHRQAVAWLQSLPFVDPKRIAFYGLSYGGETAVRVPPLVPGYCLSICSGDFNDWARKVCSTDSDYSFMFTVEWEMPYFNMGSTFNYAELAYLMVPRPFMVERGHHDGVAPDEWVAYEYAKVRWLYAQLGFADKTRIEFFNGGHTINGEGTFEFLHKQLDWPKK